MIGEIEGVPEGTEFQSRQALHTAGVHGGLINGIGKNGNSIVLSGGYIDDEDNGDTIIYTGSGGRNEKTGKQIKDQVLKSGNRFLAEHAIQGNPVRVTRGFKLDSKFSPKTGYRYDGLYRIEDFWHQNGVDEFLIYRYKLVKLDGAFNPHAKLDPAQTQTDTSRLAPEGSDSPGRKTTYTSRIIRNSAVSNWVKKTHGYRCQITGVLLETPAGPYAEGCHIRPVGKPHKGPDSRDNILCLSPNMHVLFDKGAIAIADDLSLIGVEGKLRLKPGHSLELSHIQYHRTRIYNRTS
jgi:putative restriction endonuclease